MDFRFTHDSIDELITSHIDKENSDPEVDDQIIEMIKNDDTIARKYRSELLTRDLYRSRLKPAEVPPATYSRVTGSIDDIIHSSLRLRHSSSASESAAGFWNYLFDFLKAPVRINRFAVPRYALSLFLVAVIIGVGLMIRKDRDLDLNPYITAGSDKNVMVQALKNFHKVVSGELTPNISSSDAVEVKKYMNERANFDVYIPDIGNFILSGAVCNEYNGEKIAHLIYTSKDEILYIYEAPLTYMRKGCLEIPDPVNSQVRNEKFYMCDKVDPEHNCTMLLWYTGDKLCVSVAKMPKQKMYSTFASFYHNQ